MSMKNPLTPAGIESATFRFVAQHLNHCATAVLGEGRGRKWDISGSHSGADEDSIITG